MASEPSLERLRLLIESEDEEDFDPIKDPPPIGALQRRPEDMMDEHREKSDGSHRFGMRRALPVGLALLALVAFGAIVWEAYTWGTGTGDVQEIPVIHADSEPIKTRPAEPGGLDVPHQDKLVLNEITPDPAQPQIERLLPPPEVPRPPAPAATVDLPASNLAPAGSQPDDESAAQPEPSGDGEPQAAEAQPAPSRTDEAAGTTAAEADTGAAAPQEPVVAEDPTPSPPTEVAAIPPAPVAPAPDEAPPVAKEAPKAEATAKPEPAKPQTAAAPATGGFLVQLGALKTRASADREWGRLAQAFPQLLGDRTSRIQAVDVAGKGKFHRVQAGYFADQASAAALCARLKAQKQDCIVARR